MWYKAETTRTRDGREHAKLTATSRTEPEDDGSGEWFDNLDELKEYVKAVNEGKANRSWMPFLNIVCE